MREIIIIGGGASGLAAAVSAARRGGRVTVLEQNDILGKKILSTGNGRCNLTNLYMDRDCYRGDEPGFTDPVLEAFPPEKCLAFFREMGILTGARSGYVYPLCEQASSVREAFVMELQSLGVRVRTKTRAEEIRHTKKGFRVFCSGENAPVCGDRVILAAGSRASGISGSDGSGYTLAKQLGHSLVPVTPALVQLQAKGDFFKKLAGIRVKASVGLLVDGRKEASDTGELQLTDYGISGIPVFQVSRYAARALREKRQVTARIDFMPAQTGAELYEELLRRREKWPERRADRLPVTMLPDRLTAVLLAKAGIRAARPSGEISGDAWKSFAGLCKEFPVTVTGTNSFERAQVCAGGVNTREICGETMESRLVSGLYITGELLDVDGICGGYNLHFAWGSGILAGAHAAGRGKR